MEAKKKLANELCPYKNFKWHDEPCRRCKVIEGMLDEFEKKTVSRIADKIASNMGSITVSATLLDWFIGIFVGPAIFARKSLREVCDKVIDILVKN